MASQLVAKIAPLLTPPIVPPSSQYDGLEWKYWKIGFRPAVYRYDTIMVALVIAYALTYFIGSSTNSAKVSAWFNAHKSLYSSQFTRPTSGVSGGPISDGPQGSFVYSCGRRHVKALYTTWEFSPRQDLFFSLFNILWGLITLDYKDEDLLQLDFDLNTSVGGSAGWVWAVVKKDYMEKERKGRWDLTFTKASDSNLLPKNMILMSEIADVNEALVKSLSSSQSNAKNLLTALSDPAVMPYFRSLIISDQPYRRPAIPIPAAEKERHLILTFVAPPPSKAAVTLPLLQAVFDLVDILGQSPPTFRPETTKRLRTKREELDVELKKDAERERKEEEEENKAKEKKAQREEMTNRLSASEQKKQLEKEQKRNFRKAQGKISKK